MKKDDEINKINEEIAKLIIQNDHLRHKICEVLKLRSNLEFEQRSIADYCNDLKNKFNNLDKTVR